MEHNDETYAPAAGSLFFTTDCQHLDQLSLLKPPLHDAVKTVDNAVDQPDNVTMGSMMFDMLNMQFPSGSAPPHDKLLLTDGLQHIQDQHPRAAFCHYGGDMDAPKEQEQGFDPVCFLKLPVLAHEKSMEQRFSSLNYHEYTPIGPLKNDQRDDGMKANGGGNLNWQENSCIEYSLAPVSRESHKEEGDAHHEENNLIQSFIESEIMVPEHRLCRSVQGSKLLSIDHPLVYNSDCLHPVVLSRSSSGFDQPQLNQKPKRKRSKTCKSSEEIESQRMTHIAVERNRRRQMNEHLRVLRSLMPGSYVQRGDQASIIGGAIEFVKELEQLLQCLESQKRRRLYSADGTRPTNPSVGNYLLLQPPAAQQVISYPLPNDAKLVESFLEPLREEVAEVKSPVADIEVKLAVGGDATIKILSERRPRQLLNTIAALENLQFSIFHTNVTTIEHTVLYSFNVKVNVEHLATAEDIATSVQQIFNMIQAPAGYLE